MSITFDAFIDPRGRPTVPAGSDHYFYTSRPFVRPYVPKLQNQATIPAGRDCGLAEWIIDDSCLVQFTCLSLGIRTMSLNYPCYYGNSLRVICVGGQNINKQQTNPSSML